MEYTRIRASFCEHKDRFYRVLLVRNDISLMELGFVLGTAFHASFEHLFLFESNDICYVPKEFMTFPSTSYRGMDAYCMKDLESPFRYVYDAGDNWDFEVRILPDPEEIDSNDLAFLVDGRGQGIWEDRSVTVRALLDGKVSPDLSQDDEEHGILFPWNFRVERLGDFEKPLNLEDEKERFKGASETAMDLFMNRHDRFSDDNDDLWDTYEELCDQAYAAYDDDNDDPAVWTELYDEFIRVCNVLKSENRLPDILDELDEDTMADFSILIDEAPDALENAGMYDEVIHYLTWLKDTFKLDEFDEEDVTMHLLVCQANLNDSYASLRLARDFVRNYPENMAGQGMLVRAYAAMGDNDSAREVIEKFIQDDTECTEDNYPLFRAASLFYEMTSETEKKEMIDQKIEDEEDRESGRMHTITGDDYEDILPENLELLDMCCMEFENTQSPADLLMVTAVLGKILDSDGELYCNVIEPEPGVLQVLAYADPDGNSILPVYTGEYAAFEMEDEENASLRPIPLNSIIAHIYEHDMAGLVINPTDFGSGTLVPKEAMSFLVDLLHLDLDQASGLLS